MNLAARSDPFSHIRVIPKPPSETTSEQRMQCNNPFTFKKVSFSEEAEASSSSYSNPYNWQANLANASDGSSFAQVRVSGAQFFHYIFAIWSRCRWEDWSTAEILKVSMPTWRGSADLVHLSESTCCRVECSQSAKSGANAVNR